jgi:hypothetical protein
MKVLGLILMAVTAQAQPLKFTGEVKAGKEFRKPIGRGLVWILRPGGDGWRIEVEPEAKSMTSCREFSTVLAWPLHAHGSNDIDTSYGMSARDAVSTKWDVAFVLTEADCLQERHCLEVIEEGDFRRPEYDAAIAQRRSSPLGKATLRILKSKTSSSGELVEGKDLGKIDWIRFVVTITFPKKP